MLKSLKCILLVVSVVSVSLLGKKNVGLTKEIDNQRECVVCSLKSTVTEGGEEEYLLGYTDGFWVEEDETVYLLNSYNRAVVEVKGKQVREIPVAESVLPADIVTDKDRLYIFDDILSELQIYTKQGELLLQSKIELENDYVKGLIKTEEGTAVLTYGGIEIVVNPEDGKQTCAVAEEKKIDADGYDYVEYIYTDEDKTVYSVYTELVDNCSVLAGEMTLRAITKEGQCKGSYILPMSEYKYLPGTYIHVMDNGNVYLLVPGTETVEVRKVAFHDNTVSAFAEISKTANTTGSNYDANVKRRIREGTACTEEIALSREEVRERTDAMSTYQWTLKKTHTLVSKSEKGVVLTREIAAILEKNKDKSSWSAVMTGIPYCWGGFHALDVGFKNVTFPQAVAKKYVTGNINPTGYYKYMTAGLDCSGYVSAALGFTKKQGTGGLACLGTKVKDIKELRQMDLLIWPGEHVIFFCEWINDATMLVTESNIRNSKVVTHPKTLNELIVSRQYQMRSPW